MDRLRDIRETYTEATGVMKSVEDRRRLALQSLAGYDETEWKQPYRAELKYLTLCREGVLAVAVVTGVVSGRMLLRRETMRGLHWMWKTYVYLGLIGAVDVVMARTVLGHHSQVLNLLADDYILEEHTRNNS